MKVKLISHSQAPDYNESALDLVAYCARVSNPDNQNNKETSEKLVKYLMKHKHWSPLEMVSVCMEVETTRDIARQLLRHRSFSFQEFSQRYADPTKDLEFELREARMQDPKNRQNSIPSDDPALELSWQEMQKSVIDAALDAYNFAVSNGIAKEQARAVLPEGNTLSRLYVNGTLRSWIHYIELRGANGTQQEHMDIAHAVADVIAEIFPLAEEFKGKEI
jgi:thymidylate synthase (FAD)